MSTRYPVKWFSSHMQGAPQYWTATTSVGKPTGGEFAAAIKAALVTGFGLLPADGATYDSGTGLVTVSITAGHSYLQYSIVLIEGASDPAFNGEQRVMSVTATAFTYQPETPPAGSAAVGELTVKVAPLGWQILAESDNLLCIKPTDPLAYDYALRIDDRGGSPMTQENSHYRAMVQVVTDVVDVDNYKAIRGSYYWPASSYCSDDSHAAGSAHFPTWFFVGDPRFFYYVPKFSAFGRSSLFWYGDIISYRPGDLHGTTISGTGVNIIDWRNTSSSSAYASKGSKNADVLVLSPIARPHTQMDFEENVSPIHLSKKYLGSGWGGSLGVNIIDNQVYVSQVPVLLEEAGNIRGELPGIRPFLMAHPHYGNKVFSGLFGEADRLDLALMYNKSDYFTDNSTSDHSPYDAMSAFELTKSWRP